MRYVRPRSLTWWAGTMSLGIGLMGLIYPELDRLPEMSRIIAIVLGAADASPGGLIVLGLGLIGLRDAIARGLPQQTK